MRQWNPCVESGESIESLLRPRQVFGWWVFYLTSQIFDHEPCLVKCYKTFKTHHPAEMHQPESSFYFTIKHQQNPSRRSLSWGRMKSGSQFWKQLKTIPFAKLAFQSYWIKTYLWLCSSAKRLPEHKMSPNLYKSVSIQLQRKISFTFSRLANVLTASKFPNVFSLNSSERTKTKRCWRKWTVVHIPMR